MQYVIINSEVNMKTSIILMIVTVFSKIFGLLREQTLARLFGTGIISDVFLIGFQIPMAFTNIISGATANGYIPIYNQVLKEKDLDEADKFTSNFSNILFVFTFLISILLLIFSPQLIDAMAPGFEGEKRQLAIFITKMGLMSISITSSASIFKAYLQIKKRFVVSVLHSIIMNVILMLSMYFAYKQGKNYLAYGMFLSFVLQYIIFLPYIRKEGYRHKFVFDIKDDYLKQMLKIIVPILISTSVIELNFIISKALASNVEAGGVSILNYAYKLQSFVSGIVITSIVTAVYPTMAKFGSAKDMEGLKKSSEKALSFVLFLVIPATIGLYLYAEPIVKILFLRGEFTELDAMKTMRVLMFYAIGLLGIGVREIISRVFYTINDTKTPVINSVIMVGLNIVLSLILVKKYDIDGLALATSLSFIVGAILIFISLRKKIGSLFEKRTYKNLFKILIASFVMAGISFVIHLSLLGKISYTINFLISLLSAGFIYFIMIWLLKVDELKELLNFRKNK